MFERLTDGVRKALVQAQEEAVELGHGAMGADHLLLGTLVVEDPTADLLPAHGVTASAVRTGVVDLRGRGRRRDVYHIPFTDESRHALNEAGQHGRVDLPVLTLYLLREASVRQLVLRCGADPGELEEAAARRVPAPDRAATDDSLTEIRDALRSLRNEVAALRGEIRDLREIVGRGSA